MREALRARELKEREELKALKALPKPWHPSAANLVRSVSFGANESFEVGSTSSRQSTLADSPTSRGIRPVLQRKNNQHADHSTEVFKLKRKRVMEQAKALAQGKERRPSFEGLRPRSSSEQRRPSIEGFRARLVSLGDDGDEELIEVQLEPGKSPRFCQQEQQIELLQNELDDMDERFEKQEARLRILQAEVDELKEELEEEQFLSSVSEVSGTGNGQPVLEAARKDVHTSTDAELRMQTDVKELRATVQELETMLALAREEARVSGEAELAATGSLNELQELVAELESKLEAASQVELTQTATEAQLGRQKHELQAREAELLADCGGLRRKEAQDKPKASRELSRMAALTDEASTAVLKIQALVRGRSVRTGYKLAREIESCRQWVTYYVALGRTAEAEELGWDGENPPPPTEQEREANTAAYVRGKIDHEPLVAVHTPSRNAAPASRRCHSPSYKQRATTKLLRTDESIEAFERRDNSPDYCYRPTPEWLRSAANLLPCNATKLRFRSPDYPLQRTPDWFRAPQDDSVKDCVVTRRQLAAEAAAHVADSVTDTFPDDLAREIEACRQWVAYHVSQGEYADALELGWDGKDPPPLTEQELQANIAAPPSPKDVCIEVLARPHIHPWQNMIEVSAHISSAGLSPPPLPPREKCIEVVSRPHVQVQSHQDIWDVVAHVSQINAPNPSGVRAGGDGDRGGAAGAPERRDDILQPQPTREIKPQIPSEISGAVQRHRQLAEERMAAIAEAKREAVLRDAEAKRIDLREINLTILERKASFLEQSKKNEGDLTNQEELNKVNERLELARQHNRQLAKMVAASTTVGRRARGYLTRARLRREREAERMAELQRETEKAWAKTLSRPSPNGRRGRLTRRQHVLEKAAAIAYFNLRGLPPPDSEVARHARALASAINERRVRIEERIEGIKLGTVVVVDPRAAREERLRQETWEVPASLLRTQPEMSAEVQQARRELADEKMAAITEAKRQAEIRDAEAKQSRLAAMNDRGARESMSSQYKSSHQCAQTAKASVPGDLPKGDKAESRTLGDNDCDTRRSCESSSSIEEEEGGEKKEGRGSTHGNGCNEQQSCASSEEEGEKEGEEEEWRHVCDQTTGQKYLWHICTNEVRWLTEDEEGVNGGSEDEGWERVLDQSTGREYFWHNITDEVRWTEPPELEKRSSSGSIQKKLPTSRC